MALTPATDLATQLGTDVAALTKGTNLFHGPMRAYTPGGNIPAKAVFCLDSGGPPEEKFVDAGAGGGHRRYRVQVMVRSDADDYAGGKTLADSVFDAAHLASISGWYEVEAREAQPTYLGKQENDMHVWSINIEMWA